MFRTPMVCTHLCDDAGFLEKVLFDRCPLNHSVIVKNNLNVLAESTRVIVPHCFCISKGCYVGGGILNFFDKIFYS